MLVYKSINHNRAIWAGLIAFLAWTVAEIGLGEPDSWRDVVTPWCRSANRGSPGFGKFYPFESPAEILFVKAVHLPRS